MMHQPPTGSLPTLTDVIQPGVTLPKPNFAAVSRDLLGPVPLDVPALEQRLLDELLARLTATLEQRVHASVAPAISLLADRIAYKAAQEVAGDLAERMRSDLEDAVKLAVQDAIKSR